MRFMETLIQSRKSEKFPKRKMLSIKVKGRFYKIIHGLNQIYRFQRMHCKQEHWEQFIQMDKRDRNKQYGSYFNFFHTIKMKKSSNNFFNIFNFKAVQFPYFQ